MSGEFQHGQAFPSVRALARGSQDPSEHRAQGRAVPDPGTLARGAARHRYGGGAERPEVRASDRKRLLKQEVEQLVVEAKRVGVDLKDLIESISAQWQALDQPEAKRK